MLLAVSTELMLILVCIYYLVFVSGDLFMNVFASQLILSMVFSIRSFFHLLVLFLVCLI